MTQSSFHAQFEANKIPFPVMYYTNICYAFTVFRFDLSCGISLNYFLSARKYCLKPRIWSPFSICVQLSLLFILYTHARSLSLHIRPYKGTATAVGSLGLYCAAMLVFSFPVINCIRNNCGLCINFILSTLNIHTIIIGKN